MKSLLYLSLSLSVSLVPLAAQQPKPNFQNTAWQTLKTTGKPHARHEAGLIGVGENLYLLGGRRIQPVDIYHPATKIWTHGSPPLMEIHHFQPVVRNGKILLVGAMTGVYPKEQALDHIPIYDPETDKWSKGPTIPEGRRRGGAGAVIDSNRLYIVCGIINGHWDGNVSWLDCYDFKTGKWTLLPDAPRVRDHFQAALIDGKIYAAAGRKTSASTQQVFNLTIPELDIYDIAAGTWTTAREPIPTPRAGSMSLAFKGDLLVAGGEVAKPDPARAEVELFSPQTGKWQALPSLETGRHGSGLVYLDGAIFTAAGCGARGGKPELDSTECIEVQ